MPNDTENFGVLPAIRVGSDYNERISLNGVSVRRPDGDWRPVSITHEAQRYNDGDTLACVTFSWLNSIELQARHDTGIEINLSDAYVAKATKTDELKGNDPWFVVEWGRKNNGVPDQNQWTNGSCKEEFYRDLQPRENHAYFVGKKIINRWIDSIDSIPEALKYAPVTFCGLYISDNQQGPYNGGNTNAQHQMCLIHIQKTTGGYIGTFLDHYSKPVKQFINPQYYPMLMIQSIVTPINYNQMTIPDNTLVQNVGPDYINGTMSVKATGEFGVVINNVIHTGKKETVFATHYMRSLEAAKKNPVIEPITKTLKTMALSPELWITFVKEPLPE